ncbi:exonuclease domain-containing protein [Sediminibacillus massiliensis]|uniref:exonuclease domain-containing protein n=1 Tax=Sediminibacillus massiliensis TaxID=1926277 RepID=UPI000BAE0B4E|nr:exonuclease domain-containing protein [Sediminibacillus massiliensis]
MIMDQMIHFIKEMSGRLTPGGYTSLQNQTDPGKVALMRELQREMKKKDVLQVPFNELNVVVFDLETTGFYPYKGDSILSIGAVKVKGDRLLKEEMFYEPVYNERSPSKEIEELTGITKEILQEADSLQHVLKKFYQFAKADALVAHHANHEKKFMKHATWFALKMNFQHRIIDTSFLTKIIAPTSELVTLDDCCAYYGIEIGQRHHALHDAIATAELWAHSVRSIQQLGFSNLNDVYNHIATWK